ncbi:putative ATP-dependent helicase Lhr [Neorhodopirellula pilleata]|uniref:Putative ATP-dependent helicase Lhr n=1 Tax=Neorhodopirellula pilleata TaxID=2714738 RepID=A0A5C5ZLQ7_9BACT|nr:ligase-associated DNA damage response DEXH box helicase [Neorhodopirellula pilleata]TWT87917.1 putative ATP-dependent helicase Lhr [Neorhodopirellula pilleata]
MSQNSQPRTEIDRFFRAAGNVPFAFQRSAWAAYGRGESGLIHSATGTGKTLAVWLGPILDWLKQNRDRSKWDSKHPPGLRVLWITPLKALAGDTIEALQAPLDFLEMPWRLEGRTGDTKQSLKAKQLKVLPTAMVTTPESLSLMLTHEKLHRQLAGLETVIVDEWHELLGTKRGVQTELALARLRSLAPSLTTWGVSATLGNLDEALSSLVGPENVGRARIISGYKRKKIELFSILPPVIERFPWSGHIGTRMIPEVAKEIESAASSLIFANTRSQTEIWYQKLLAHRPDWAGQIALHHGSLDHSVRKWVEDGLRNGTLKSVVCTSSLDLGVDFTAVDLVIQIGSPKGAARLLQRAGRSGHSPGATSRLGFVPTNALELIELAAAQDAIAAGRLESRPLLPAPLDVLIQHLVTVAIGGGFESDSMLSEIRKTRAYESLTDQQWQFALDFIVRGGSTLDAYPEFKRVDVIDGRYVVTQKRVSSLHRMNIGTIVSDASMQVKFMTGGTLGTVEESFVSKLKEGEKFLFAGRLVELVHIKENQAYVKRAKGTPDTVPRWMGGRLPLSSELAWGLRMKLEEAATGTFRGREMKRLRPLLELQSRWSCVPTTNQLLIELIKTRDGYQMFVFPFAGRLAHEGLAAVIAHRLSRIQKISFSFACNDYGLVLTSPIEAPLCEAISKGLLSPDRLDEDIRESLNATEMSRRAFRPIARIAGLIQGGYPGRPKPSKHLQASSNLFFEVFREYDPQNLLLRQCDDEVLQQQLDRQRMWDALMWIERAKTIICRPPKVTPLAFGLLVDRLRDRVSSETLADRVARMQASLEKAAQG